MIALFKHAKNFVGDETRPLFQCIYFDGENVVVTNTNLMVIRQNMPMPERLINFKTGHEFSGKYPDYRKVIPEKAEFYTTFTNIAEFTKALKVIMSFTDKHNGYICSLEGTFLSAKYNNMIFTANLTGTILGKPNEEIFFNAKYLHDVLAYFKDEEVKKVTIGFNSPIKPFVLITDKDVMAVITPIRVVTNK